ncbi:MAG: YceD family protein [Acidobacteriota bacterium]
MLRLDLTRADTEPLGFSERLTVSCDDGGDVVSAGPLALEGTVEKIERGYVVRARVDGAARLRCVRCLNEFDFSFSEVVEIELLPEAAAPRDEESRLGRNELEVKFFREPVLDLIELAGEQLQLAVPMKPLCRESCLGLCPLCGADRNQGTCSCTPEADARWAPLLAWRTQSHE